MDPVCGGGKNTLDQGGSCTTDAGGKTSGICTQTLNIKPIADGGACPPMPGEAPNDDDGGVSVSAAETRGAAAA